MSIGTSIIRLDASPTIGGGHLSRCLLMAKKMNAEGWDIIFVTAEKLAINLIEKNGYFCEAITYKEKIPSHLIKKDGPIVIISDVNSKVIFDEDREYKKYINTLHQQADLLLTFEDMVDYPYPADIVVIPYCGAEKLKIDNTNTATKYLLGPKYFPLKDEFRNITTTTSNKVSNIIVTMGGSDPEKITLKVLHALNDEGVDDLITIIVGGMSEISDQDIRDCSRNIMDNILIKRDVSDISGIFYEGDIAFTNSGLTKYELAAVGVPMIILSNTEQQSKYCDLFSLEGASIHLGFHTLVEDVEIIKAYNELVTCEKKRNYMFDTGKKLVNGEGIQEIYDEIELSLQGACPYE